MKGGFSLQRNIMQYRGSLKRGIDNWFTSYDLGKYSKWAPGLLELIIRVTHF